MLNRKFTLRETILLVLCAIIGLGIFYYEIAYKGFKNSIASYNTENLQNEIIAYEAKVAKKKSMEDYIRKHKGDTYGEVALYNNQANEIEALGQIFEGIENIVISWSDPTLTDTTVRRNASVSFSVDGYNNVTSLINAINKCKYRCLISDLSISASGNSVLDEKNRINVRMNVTFFERVDSTTNLEGLTVINN